MSSSGTQESTEVSSDRGVRTRKRLHALSLGDPEAFWRPVAEELHWAEHQGPVFRSIVEPPYGRWFESWTTNLAYNSLDRHLRNGQGGRVAYYSEGESGEQRTLTYADLHAEVSRCAAAFQDLGVRKGDRVTIYLPMIPELPIAMLAAARIGALHSVIFAGFTARAIEERVRDSTSSLVVTADGAFRRGKLLPLKRAVDEALRRAPSVKAVVVVRRAGNPVMMRPGRDVWWDELTRRGFDAPAPVWVPGTHPSFVLYTSGTTGKPKGAVHGTGGYMVWLHYTQRAVFDPKPSDVYWCAADIGWVTGHSYIVYGPLLEGMSSVLFEGTPDYPDPGRWWDIVEKYRVSTLYTSPTAIRLHMKFGESWANSRDLSSLRLLGSVGEAINPEAWRWYRRNIGAGSTPIVDTWWQTETGGILVSPTPGIANIPLKPGSATLPLPGVDLDIVDSDGRPSATGERGFVVIRRPWPGEFLTLWNDEERYRATYFSRFQGVYYTGDYARRDSDGYVWFLGRADEVLKVAGHRIGTIELENALITHAAVAESAVIGKSDPVRMQVPVAFVVLRPGFRPSERLRVELIECVRSEIGPFARPEAVHFVERLPKTRSGKIMRRVIGAVVEEHPVGDVTTLEDEASIEEARRAFRALRREVETRRSAGDPAQVRRRRKDTARRTSRR